ncbi:hypothetical protein AAFF_G00201490 [Aldrovandia affinis]|uniref:Uncharacterized protein n=1 Tax=Aldrovandia affinis TaxID=143900 RepID=A0AAD7SWW5_9TELE|nr:hypothetical protein AAFF_G00201490 [Aldrovandia affinis]
MRREPELSFWDVCEEAKSMEQEIKQMRALEEAGHDGTTPTVCQLPPTPNQPPERQPGGMALDLYGVSETEGGGEMGRCWSRDSSGEDGGVNSGGEQPTPAEFRTLSRAGQQLLQEWDHLEVQNWVLVRWEPTG